MFGERTETIRKIHDLKLSKVDLAGIAEVAPARVTEFITHRSLSADKVQRIIAAVADISFVWAALAPFKLDTSDPDIFRRAVKELRGTVSRLSREREMPLPLATMRELSSAVEMATEMQFKD